MSSKDDKRQQNEGEGNKTSAREYNQAAEGYAKSGKATQAAREAAEALGREREELEAAERAGKKRIAEDEPGGGVLHVRYDRGAWVIAPEGEKPTHRFDELEDAERRANEIASESGALVLVHSPEGGVIERHAPSTH